MDKKEIFKIIRTLRVNHGISLGEIEDIQLRETEKLSSIENIFDMSNQKDVDLLVALIYLLNDEPDNLYKWFKTTHSDCKYLISPKKTSIPAEDYRLLIAAFIQNPLFFSMAWNWNIFNLNSVGDSKSVPETDTKDSESTYIPGVFETDSDFSCPQCEESSLYVYASAAGTPGFNNITRIPINLLGELEIRGNLEAKRIVFVLFLNPECRDMKFEFRISCEIANESYDAIITKDDSEKVDEVRSQLIHADFSKGIHITKFEWKPL